MKECCKDKKNLAARLRGTTEFETYCKKCGKTKKSYEVKR